MATLYTRAESNTRKTWFLIFVFLILVIGLGYLFSYLLDNFAILIGAVTLSILMSFGSYWYSDKVVLKMSKARPASEEEFPELYRTVENLCITSGLPQPDLFVIKSPQPNAFAAGRDPEHSVIAVTTALMKKLERNSVSSLSD